MSITEAVRRLVNVGDYVLNAQLAGDEIMIGKPGKHREIVFGGFA